jgi:tRNA (guanosine-2'-O-)-methyltransferase
MTPERLAKIDGVLARRQPDLTILAENLHKPRNFSALVRTCDSVGVGEIHAVCGDEPLSTHWHTSQGAEKWVTVMPYETVSAAVAELRQQGFSIVAAHLSEHAVDYRSWDYTRLTALLMGSELFGVSDAALEHVDTEIIIPMMGMSQSLNVSVACALVLYEAQRQRMQAGMYAQRRLADAQWPAYASRYVRAAQAG